MIGVGKQEFDPTVLTEERAKALLKRQVILDLKDGLEDLLNEKIQLKQVEVENKNDKGKSRNFFISKVRVLVLAEDQIDQLLGMLD